MLAIRMQRTGRKGHAQFRVIVQDSRKHPSSGNIVALIGSYDPHTKASTLQKEKASFYLDHGAQPSDRVAKLLKSEGVKLPKWVQTTAKKSGNIKNTEKLRKHRPAEEKKEESSKAEVVDEAKPEETFETSVEESTTPEADELATEEAPKEEKESEEKPAE